MTKKADSMERENKKLRLENTEFRNKIEYLEAQLTEAREAQLHRQNSSRLMEMEDDDEERDFEVRRLTKEIERCQYDLQMSQTQHKEEVDFYTRQLADYDARMLSYP